MHSVFCIVILSGIKNIRMTPISSRAPELVVNMSVTVHLIVTMLVKLPFVFARDVCGNRNRMSTFQHKLFPRSSQQDLKSGESDCPESVLLTSPVKYLLLSIYISKLLSKSITTHNILHCLHCIDKLSYLGIALGIYKVESHCGASLWEDWLRLRSQRTSMQHCVTNDTTQPNSSAEEYRPSAMHPFTGVFNITIFITYIFTYLLVIWKKAASCGLCQIDIFEWILNYVTCICACHYRIAFTTVAHF